MKFTILIINIFLILAIADTAYCQPVQRTQQEVSGLQVYQDLKNPQLFYYAPGNLRLGRETTEEPKFKLIETRYTGTKLRDDQLEKRFFGIIQFTVQLERIENRQLLAAKKALKKQVGGTINLRPMPMQFIETRLLVSANKQYQEIGNGGGLQADESTGNTTKRIYWTERTFTMQLDQHGSQLIKDQLKNQRLALSLGYAFHANVITEQGFDYSLDGDTTAVNELAEELDQLNEIDSIPVSMVIRSDAFTIDIDVAEYPHLFQKIDINESGFPVDYPALEIKCYDFTNDLRPDLQMKTIDLKALSNNGQYVVIEGISFSTYQPDLNTVTPKFSFPVKMDKPLRYQITEYPVDGAPVIQPWQEKRDWTGLLDITTPLENNPFDRRVLEIETELGAFAQHEVSTLDWNLMYTWKGKNRRQKLTFGINDPLPTKQLTILHDKGTPLYYFPTWHYQNGSKINKRKKPIPSDSYVYIPVKK